MEQQPPQTLLEWVRGYAMVHPSIALKDRTVVATQTIPAETCLMKIPLTLVEDDDVALALHLLTSRETCKPYWNSLPRQIILPQDHPERFDAILKGSPVLQHIQEMRKSTHDQYQKLTSAVVSFDDFSYAMAVVSSRAFDVLDNNRMALIPLLDMCNHARGTKNISYQFNDAAVTVRSVADIPADTPLVMTYGAKPNAVLLCNYGFCIPNNVEPDGSSNDSLEFAKDIYLRTGGKAYTYGVFVKALECVVSSETVASTMDDDDMEAFLNGCDDDHGEEDFDAMYSGDFDSGELETPRTLAGEVEVLNQFIDCCDEKLRSYRMRGDSLRSRMEYSDLDYCAILIHSEQRILFFFRNVACTIVAKLQNNPGKCPSWGIPLTAEDQDLLQSQMAELVQAYLQIRHPERLLSVSPG